MAPGIINNESRKMAMWTFFRCGMSHFENDAKSLPIAIGLVIAFSSDVFF